MTDPKSHPGDNNGCCECCNRESTKFRRQCTYPVYLGGYDGGPKLGTLWLCGDCYALVLERDRGHEPGKGKFTEAQLKRLDALKDPARA